MYDFLFLPMLPPQIKSKACDGHSCQFRSLGSVVREDCFPPSSAALWLQSLLPDLASCDWLLDTHLYPALKIGKWVRYTRVAGKRPEWSGREDLDSYIPSPPAFFKLKMIDRFESFYSLLFSRGEQFSFLFFIWFSSARERLCMTVSSVSTPHLHGVPCVDNQTDWTVAVCPLFGLWLLLILLPAWSSYITFKKRDYKLFSLQDFSGTSLSLE